MATLYEDRYVTLDDAGITIRLYYFPIGSAKTIPYAEIKSVREAPLIPFLETFRLWGGGWRGQWLHWDLRRPLKGKCIILDTGAWVDPGITPEDHDRVLALLREKIGR